MLVIIYSVFVVVVEVFSPPFVFFLNEVFFTYGGFSLKQSESFE